MVINISVQYNGWLLLDIILLTLCDYIGEPFKCHVCRAFSFVPTVNVLT